LLPFFLKNKPEEGEKDMAVEDYKQLLIDARAAVAASDAAISPLSSLIAEYDVNNADPVLKESIGAAIDAIVNPPEEE
jgi:N-methylhydantoinase B/oxoprolinase/acetone carboxylase alpha subunit